jgi:hypothetical protein
LQTLSLITAQRVIRIFPAGSPLSSSAAARPLLLLKSLASHGYQPSFGEERGKKWILKEVESTTALAAGFLLSRTHRLWDEGKKIDIIPE